MLELGTGVPILASLSRNWLPLEMDAKSLREQERIRNAWHIGDDAMTT